MNPTALRFARQVMHAVRKRLSHPWSGSSAAPFGELAGYVFRRDLKLLDAVILDAAGQPGRGRAGQALPRHRSGRNALVSHGQVDQAHHG